MWGTNVYRRDEPSIDSTRSLGSPSMPWGEGDDGD